MGYISVDNASPTPSRAERSHIPAGKEQVFFQSYDLAASPHHELHFEVHRDGSASLAIVNYQLGEIEWLLEFTQAEGEEIQVGLNPKLTVKTI